MRSAEITNTSEIIFQSIVDKYFTMSVHTFLCVQVCVKAHVSLGRQHSLELNENGSTLLPAMPLISRIRLQEITVLPQTTFGPTLAPAQL